MSSSQLAPSWNPTVLEDELKLLREVIPLPHRLQRFSYFVYFFVSSLDSLEILVRILQSLL